MAGRKDAKHTSRAALRLPDLPPGGRAWDETLSLTASDGVGLRGAVWRGDGERGRALLLTGRTEFLEKAAIPAAALVERGFSVASLDWRGQGLSTRLLDDPLKGHVDSFESYHRDLDALLAHPAVASLGGPTLIVAHSMGGTICVGAMLRGRLEADALALSAPMLGVAMSPAARALSRGTIRLARTAGLMERWIPVPSPEEPYVFSGFDGNVLTGDRAVFEWMREALHREPRLQLGMPTIGWMDAAERETNWIAGQNGLSASALCLIGSEEEVVDVSAIRAAAPRLGFRLVEIAGGRHELLIESAAIRAEAWRAIDQFLDRQGF